MRYEEPNMQIILLNEADLVRTSVQEDEGLPEDKEDW